MSTGSSWGILAYRRITIGPLSIIAADEKEPNGGDRGQAVADDTVRPPVSEKALGIGGEEKHHEDVYCHSKGPPRI